MTCTTCGAVLPARRGRPRLWCDAHTPPETARKRVEYAERQKRKRAARVASETK